MWFSVELLQNCPVLELRHLFIIQWNLDVTNLYLTKFSVQRQFFYPRNSKIHELTRARNNETSIFSVFTVTPSKIKIETIQSRKSRIWEVKEDKYTKSLTIKNQACAIFHVRDIRKNVLPNFIKHVGVPLRDINMASRNQQKHLFLSSPTNARIHRLRNS